MVLPQAIGVKASTISLRIGRGAVDDPSPTVAKSRPMRRVTSASGAVTTSLRRERAMPVFLMHVTRWTATALVPLVVLAACGGGGGNSPPPPPVTPPTDLSYSTPIVGT